MAAGWASAIGAGVNAAMNLLGSQNSNATSVLQNKELMKYQYSLNKKGAKWQALNIPTYNRQGIENAGYNPMLALNGLLNANSNWSGLGSPTTSDIGSIGSQRVEMQNALQQQENQNSITASQVENTNADTVLKQQQAITETYDQVQKQIHADNEYIDSQLKREDLTHYERKFLQDMKESNMRIERMGIENKADMMRASADQQNAVSNRMNSITNKYNATTMRNTRTDTISLHGPLGSGTTRSSTGYKPTLTEKYSIKPDYTYEYIKGKKVRVKNYH